MENLSNSILSTLTYYDVLDYPLTSFEIWKYLIIYDIQNKVSSKEKERYSLADIIKELDNKKLEKYIEQSRGFYFLRERKKLVEQRISRNKISQRKFKIIKKVVRWLSFMPYVRMIAITGRVSMKNACKKSDLDFLIILKQGKIFTGRTLVTAMTHILGKRRYADKIMNRVCLNYFIADESLQINTQDFFSSSEYSFMFPVFGWETFQKFQKQNSWIKNYKINYQPDEISNLKIIPDNFWSKLVRGWGENFLEFNFIENKLRKWQMRRINNDPRTHKKGSGVMANDEALVFLPDPQGPKVYEKFKNKLKLLKN